MFETARSLVENIAVGWNYYLDMVLILSHRVARSSMKRCRIHTLNEVHLSSIVSYRPKGLPHQSSGQCPTLLTGQPRKCQATLGEIAGGGECVTRGQSIVSTYHGCHAQGVSSDHSHSRQILTQPDPRDALMLSQDTHLDSVADMARASFSNQSPASPALSARPSPKFNPTAQTFTPSKSYMLAPTFNAVTGSDIMLKSSKDFIPSCPLCHDKFFCPVCNTEDDTQPTPFEAPETADFNRTPGHAREAGFAAMVKAAKAEKEDEENVRDPSEGEKSLKIPFGNRGAAQKRVDRGLTGVEGGKGQ